MSKHLYTKGGEYMTSPPLESTRFGAMNMDAPIWDAEQTKRLLQALEAKMCGLVDVLSERIDQVSDRLDKIEEWQPYYDQYTAAVRAVRDLRGCDE